MAPAVTIMSVRVEYVFATNVKPVSNGRSQILIVARQTISVRVGGARAGVMRSRVAGYATQQGAWVQTVFIRKSVSLDIAFAMNVTAPDPGNQSTMFSMEERVRVALTASVGCAWVGTVQPVVSAEPPSQMEALAP